MKEDFDEPEIEDDPERENRIAMEIIVDSYDSEEQALGWYYYLDVKLQFPFLAQCIKERRISPLTEGEKVQVVRMASENECQHEMFVEVEWKQRILGVPLAQLMPIDVDDQTTEAVEDWHYWVAMGYEL